MTGIGSHTRPNDGATNEWLTPPEIIRALGPFDLDPCSTTHPPWRTARTMYFEAGLSLPWHGRVWLNPPYGPALGAWLHRLAEHGDGIAIAFARTETHAFFEWVWPKASGLLFVKGRIRFHRLDGSLPLWTSGGPSVLIAYGNENADRLQSGNGIPGAFVRLRP